jgi:hypothetical protein
MGITIYAETEEHLKCLHDLLAEFKSPFQEKPEKDGDIPAREATENQTDELRENSVQIISSDLSNARNEKSSEDYASKEENGESRDQQCQSLPGDKERLLLDG